MPTVPTEYTYDRYCSVCIMVHRLVVGWLVFNGTVAHLLTIKIRLTDNKRSTSKYKKTSKTIF